MQIWSFLHILSMFAAVTVVVGAMLWAVVAIRRRDIGALRAYFRVSRRADNVGTLLFAAGIIFGLVAAMVIGWDLLVPWLVVAYVLVVVVIVLGAGAGPYLKRVEAALPENDDDAVDADLEPLLSSPLPVVIAVISILAVAGIISMMVFKPTAFS